MPHSSEIGFPWSTIHSFLAFLTSHPLPSKFWIYHSKIKRPATDKEQDRRNSDLFKTKTETHFSVSKAHPWLTEVKQSHSRSITLFTRHFYGKRKYHVKNRSEAARICSSNDSDRNHRMTKYTVQQKNNSDISTTKLTANMVRHLHRKFSKVHQNIFINSMAFIMSFSPLSSSIVGNPTLPTALCYSLHFRIPVILFSLHDHFKIHRCWQFAKGTVLTLHLAYDQKVVHSGPLVREFKFCSVDL